ncbi:MAG: ATP-grasp domain-containing protein [Acidimicrobiia bacterium]|nr:ATP-grasp domain-containing protein [Acidimicrobiia bacterium]NNL27107.1 ATP-grasp domain-containing protein [Acidimicrobiia bacterium]
MKRVVIVASAESYRTADFLGAARLLRLDVVVASDGISPIAGASRVHIELADVERAAIEIASIEPTPDAVVAIDDEGVLIAAAASQLLGISCNPPSAVEATRDKAIMRALLARTGVRQPRFRLAGIGQIPDMAHALGFPVVIKPRTLSASRGVIRADDREGARAAEERVRKILAKAGKDPESDLLVEQFIEGEEIAIEGLVSDGELEVLAVIDKPDPLDGPFFEETLFVTPSRHPAHVIEASVGVVQQAVAALGLVTGPVHAEVRLSETGPNLIEIASRTIGGLCGRALSFGLLGESLETVVLKAALGVSTSDHEPTRPASGVLMLPIPATGVLSDVDGMTEALEVDGIDGVEVTVARGRRVTALPEGDRYLGFVFASGQDPEQVEDSLRAAAQVLSVTIDGESMRPAVE